jgi:hypothetical protein
MKRVLIASLAALLCACAVEAQNITNVVETGGDNEATDTITAKWTGQTFTVSVANEPVPGAVIGQPYTVGLFGHFAPTFVDRNHRYANDPVTGVATLPIPAYLVGNEYIMSGNDNRDDATNANYRLDVTVANESIAYMLIDNRMSASTAADDNLDPPTFDATHMQWILDQGWLATANGMNRLHDPTRPDELAIDEGADNTINQWYSVYYKRVPAGTFSLFQANNDGQNMYGVVVGPVPEPGSMLGLAAIGALGLMRRRRA